MTIDQLQFRVRVATAGVAPPWPHLRRHLLCRMKERRRGGRMTTAMRSQAEGRQRTSTQTSTRVLFVFNLLSFLIPIRSIVTDLLPRYNPFVPYECVSV